MTNRTSLGYDPLAELVQRDPYPFYAVLRADAPVAYVESLQAYAVSRHADVRRVMRDHEAFSSEAMAALVSRPAEYTVESGEASTFPVSIVGLDGDAHTRLRLIVNRAFTPKRIGMIENDIRRAARGLVDALVVGESGDVQAGLAVPLPTIVIAAMLGIPPARRDDFRRWSEDMVRGVFEPLDGAGQAQVAQSGDDMGDFLDAAIAARSQGEARDDMISVLLRAEGGASALTRDEMKVFVFTLLVAGSITTAYLIGTAAHVLAGDPGLVARARLGATAAIVEETLRFDTPAQLMFRTATTAVEIAGTTIPRGATVLALLGSANRDAEVFAEPDRFDPDRDTTEHLSFGQGVHFCLGAALARMEARVALEELVARAPRLAAAGAVERVSSIVFRGPTRLPVQFV